VTPAPPTPEPAWAADLSPATTLARNISTRYAAILVEAALGLLILPFNVRHLGQAAYGLWMLAASVTAYFSILDLGYGGALVKFVAQYRARRDSQAINEILSTLLFVFTAVGAITFAVALLLASYLAVIFRLAPAEAATGRTVLIIVSTNVAVGFVVTVFGAVINGFQRFDLNNGVSILASLAVALVNVLVLLAGYGLVGVVASTTVVRLLAYYVYRANAYRVFPDLKLRFRFFRIARLREVTGFSVYMLLLDWANKLNYSVDALVIGAFINIAAVAVWTVAQRLAEVTQRLTTQMSDVLFPTVVDSDASAQADRLQRILIHGTRLSLASVVPIAGALIVLGGPLVASWVGPDFSGSVAIVRLLAVVVAIRVSNATAATVLKGAGEHRLLAAVNSLTALANIGLSLALVRPFGLVGVALSTLVPVAATAMAVLLPAACRRVGLPIRSVLARAVWPAVWPAVPMFAWLIATRGQVPPRLLAVGADGAVGALIYFTLFIAFGLLPDERRYFTLKAIAWVRSWPRMDSAASGTR
jgi:O-antigen/teichoic acid export membrane protein